MKLLSNEEAAAFLGIATNTLPRWRWAGTGPRFLKVGRSVKYRLEDLEVYLEGRTVEPRNETFAKAN